jgi:hypothetical protein
LVNKKNIYYYNIKKFIYKGDLNQPTNVLQVNGGDVSEQLALEVISLIQSNQPDLELLIHLALNMVELK